MSQVLKHIHLQVKLVSERRKGGVKMRGLIILAVLISWNTWLHGEIKSSLNRPITDEVFYFIMTDRFSNGDPSNDRGHIKTSSSDADSEQDIMKHGFYPENKGFYHGGDFKGIISKLDYLSSLGITALWLSPVQKNQAVQGDGTFAGSSSGYHGYWISDFTTVDPHLGTEDDFKKLVDEAHKRNMKVFIDVITNHTADTISYQGCGSCPYRSRADFPYETKKDGKIINEGFVDGDLSVENFAKLQNPNYAYKPYVRKDPGKIKRPNWLNEVIYYHNRGDSTFSGENSLYGDFFGLDDLFTEHPRVVQGMIEIYKNWITKYRVDGFRMDTVKHVNIEFWQQFVPAMRQHAQDIGIPHFYIFGEVFSGNPEILSRYVREGRLNSVLDFAFQGSVRDVFANGLKGKLIEDVIEQDDLYRINGHPNELMNFISNHDVGRFGHFLNMAKDNKRFSLDPLKQSRLAHAFMFFSRGVPVLYYGDEQGFTGDGGDKDAREDMFPSKVSSYNDNNLIGTKASTAIDNFNQQHPLFQEIREFSKIYSQHPALRHGQQEFVDFNDDALIAFTRHVFASKDEYLVVFNNSGAVKSIQWQRPGSKMVMPQGVFSINKKIPPQDFIIIKSPKQNVSSNDIQGLVLQPAKDYQSVAGLFTFEVQVKNKTYQKVNFSVEHDGKDKELMTDYNRPFRAFIDADDFPAGSKLTLKANVTSEDGKNKIFERKVVVDRRKPKVIVHYQNGNDRREVFHLLSSGKATIAKTMKSKDSAYSFDWPQDESGALLIYSSKAMNGKSDYDAPIYLDFQEHVSKNLKVKDGRLIAELYINNAGNISSTAQLVNSKAKIIEDSKNSTPPLQDTTIYLRGDMNSWKASDPMKYQGNYTYSHSIALDIGTIQYKFADSAWQAETNFGAPIDHQGINLSAASKNLSIELGSEDKGHYTIEFVHVPKFKVNGRTERLSFYKFSKN